MLNRIVLVGLISSLVGCAGLKTPTPADKDAKNQTWTYDCCNPGLSEGTKELCQIARKTKNHTLVDNYGNHYKFIWSDCEPGKEKWQEYE